MPILNQLELPLCKLTPKATPDLLRELKYYLAGRGWVNARQISQDKGWSDRLIRKLAEMSEGQILGAQAGYRLTVEADVEDIDHAANQLISQGKKMIQRALRIRRLAHSKIG